MCVLGLSYFLKRYIEVPPSYQWEGPFFWKMGLFQMSSLRWVTRVGSHLVWLLFLLKRENPTEKQTSTEIEHDWKGTSEILPAYKIKFQGHSYSCLAERRMLWTQNRQEVLLCDWETQKLETGSYKRSAERPCLFLASDSSCGSTFNPIEELSVW